MAACFLLTGLAFFHQSMNQQLALPEPGRNMMTVSNLSSGFILPPGNRHSLHNNPASRFEWTNDKAFTSSVTSFLPAQVN